MSPQVERLKTLEIGRSVSYFTVDPSSEMPFDVALFDDQVMAMLGDIEAGILKHIVIGDKMFVFPFGVRHSVFYSTLTSDGKIAGELQCGGVIQAIFADPENPRRRIVGYASSLDQWHNLRMEQSDAYRDTVLKEKLGEFFEVAER